MPIDIPFRIHLEDPFPQFEQYQPFSGSLSPYESYMVLMYMARYMGNNGYMLLDDVLEESMDDDGLTRRDVSFDVKTVSYDKEIMCDQCSICFSNFSDKEDVGCLDCGHVFHKGCIEEWMRYKTVCPLCRNTVDN